MAQVYTADVIASVEDWLKDNFPDPSVSFIPVGAEVPRSFTGTLPDKWIAVQWIKFQEPQPSRATTDWQTVDIRFLCYSRTNDRLAAAGMADDIKALMANGFVTVKLRADGTTTVGHVRFMQVDIAPPQRDERDVTVSVVDVVGWANPS